MMNKTREASNTRYQKLFHDEGRPRVLVAGVDEIDKQFVYRKMDKLTSSLKNPIIVTAHLPGTEQCAEDWCFERGLNNRRYYEMWYKGKDPELMRLQDMCS